MRCLVLLPHNTHSHTNLTSLRDGRWLNDEVINFHFNMLNGALCQHTHSHMLSVLSVNGLDDTIIDTERVKRVCFTLILYLNWSAEVQ